jgi:hypothetical protein
VDGAVVNVPVATGNGIMRKNDAVVSRRTTSVQHTTGSSKPGTGNSVLHSEQDAVALSIPTGNESSNNRETELRVLCTILECVLYETFSGDKLFMAFARAKDIIDEMNSPRADEIFKRLVKLADGTRKKNPLFRAFGY